MVSILLAACLQVIEILHLVLVSTMVVVATMVLEATTQLLHLRMGVGIILNTTTAVIRKVSLHTAEDTILTTLATKSDTLALYKQCIPTINKFAKKFSFDDKELLNDLKQVGALGFLKALNKWDASFNGGKANFPTFAYGYIRGEMLHYLRDQRHIITPNRNEQPYLFTPFERETDEGVQVLDFADNKPCAYKRIDLKDWLYHSLKQLPEKNRMIIEGVYFEGLAQTEIARKLKVNPMYVSRATASSLKDLRALLTRSI